jgi:hypothetical protein
MGSSPNQLLRSEREYFMLVLIYDLKSISPKKEYYSAAWASTCTNLLYGNNKQFSKSLKTEKNDELGDFMECLRETVP